MSLLKTRITDDMKQFMRNKDTAKLAAIRLILSEMKQIEVDKRIELKDSDIIVILDKMAKQRRDSIEQFSKAQRNDLVEIENSELDLIKSYLPSPLNAVELQQLVKAAISETGAKTMQDMAKVMATLKPQIQGRADIKQVSLLVKENLE